MIVLDASAGVDLLLRSDAGVEVRERIVDAPLSTAAHFDAEVFSALARLSRTGVMSVATVDARLGLLAALDVTRIPITDELLRAAWSLRENVAARDALYVALARFLGARLVTTDQKLARAVPDLVH